MKFLNSLLLTQSNLLSFLIVGSLLFTLGCHQSNTSENSFRSIDDIFQSYHTFKQQINPIEATKAGEKSYNNKIANYISSDYQDYLKGQYDLYLDTLGTFDATSVTSSQWLSIQTMQWDCSVKRAGLLQPLVTMASPMYNLPSFELMPLIQVQSLHLYVAQLAAGNSVHPFETIEDYDQWLQRTTDYLTFLDTCIIKMKLGMSQGIVLPKSLVQKVLPQLEPFITESIESHLFYTPIKNMPTYFNSVESDRLATAYRNMINEELKPKYRELRAFLKNEYLPKSRSTSGLGSLPGGLETYQYLVRLHTTTDLTIDEIHNKGLTEVDRILSEMEKAKKSMGFNGDIKDFFEFIRNSPEQMPFTQPEQVIQHFDEIKWRVGDSLSALFNLKPKATFEVRRTEAFREASASAEYVPGSKDASRSGIFYVPIPDVTHYNKYADEALFLHEAIPGHHYQLSLQQENKQLPAFLHPESLGVFVEGWALYAESLGRELGLYQDPIQYFGMLSMEMHRAIRLVVDTGIHGKGWTRAQAIQYSLDHEAESEASIISEIERYMATPGQALSYKIGQLKIQELRSRAKKKLGDKFDIKAFHDQVLNTGSLPLIVLEKKINNWITTQGAGEKS